MTLDLTPDGLPARLRPLATRVVDLYRTLRPRDGVQRRAEAEAAVVAYVDTLG